jgi:trafficking protein particle complex subunit 6
MDKSSKLVAEGLLEYLLRDVLALDDGESGEVDKLDAMGFDVGFRLTESASSEMSFLGLDPLDKIKFVCKDFWLSLFRKKMDKLQTNHRGIFVLSDNNFKWLEHHVPDNEASNKEASKMMRFMCGILRGSLENLGIPAMVTADFSIHPACNFHLQISK